MLPVFTSLYFCPTIEDSSSEMLAWKILSWSPPLSSPYHSFVFVEFCSGILTFVVFYCLSFSQWNVCSMKAIDLCYWG